MLDNGAAVKQHNDMDLADLTDPELVHQNLCRLAKTRSEMDYEIGSWLAAAHRLSIHEALGHASFEAYVEWLFGFSRRKSREHLRVALALEELPLLAAALRTGALSWSAARELSRVAVEETEAKWIDAAAGKTMRGVERMVARHRKGAGPFDPPTAEAPKRITLEVSAPTWALFQELKKAVTAEVGGRADDDTLVATIARAVLAKGGLANGGLAGGAREEGTAPYQIGMTICERCRTATQRAGGDEVVVDEATVEQAQCDAQHLGRVDVSTPARATQAIPPRVRRAVLHRHGSRCAVPGCGHSAFVDLHHIERRADGGDHDPERLIALCGAHHKATHVGTLVIRGTYSSGFVFEHADGVRFGDAAASPARSSVLAQVLEALVGMGWKQREAQGMVDRARTHVGPATKVEDALRLALQQAPLSSAMVREELATYERLAA